MRQIGPGDPGPDSPRTPPERLRRRRDFSDVMRTGKRSRHAILQVVARSTGEPVTRVGFSVGRQVGGAVVRNRVKRRLRHLVRDLDWREGYDIVILAREGIESTRFVEVREALSATAGRIGLLHTEKA